MSRRWGLLAVVVPVLGLAVMVGRAEFTRQRGGVWTIPIEGYDPRDLIHGQYLQYQYKLKWRGEDTCGAGERQPREGCCLCLARDEPGGYDPFVRQVECDRVPTSCDGVVQSRGVMPPQRYFVPEDRARDIEAGVRQHEASIELAIGSGREPAVRELLLDRRPWRDVLGP